MTDERKKDLGFKLQNIINDLADIVEETHVGISLMTLYNDDSGHSNCNFLHTEDGRLITLDDGEVKDAFFIEHDDTVRKEEEEDER